MNETRARASAGMVVAWIATACVAAAQERDLSGLRPGVTTYAEVAARDREPEWGPPDFEWDGEMYLERPHVLLNSLTSIGGVEEVPGEERLAIGTTLRFDPKESAAWHLVPIRVRQYGRRLDGPVVGDGTAGETVHLVFRADEKGNPGALLVVRVALSRGEVRREEIESKLGPPDEVRYLYIDAIGKKRVRRDFLLHQYPKRGVAYVWDERLQTYVARLTIPRTD